MKKFSFARTLVLLCFAFLFWSCSSEEKIDIASAQGGFEYGKELEEDERFEEALVQYRNVKNKHPYSRYAVDSELQIAEIHFKREGYLEAQHAYQTFKEFHPKHPRIAYVTYRLALSYFKQLPETVDRDLSEARRAIVYFDEVITSFPDSEFVKPSIESKRKTLEMLAGKVYYIADFYFIREHWLSARTRFEDLLRRFPNLGFDSKALYGAAVSAARLGEKNLSDKYYEELKTKFPKSDEFTKAQRDLGRD